jgi:hypothetical protein
MFLCRAKLVQLRCLYIDHTQPIPTKTSRSSNKDVRWRRATARINGTHANELIMRRRYERHQTPELMLAGI